MNYKKVLMMDESMEDLVNELIENIEDILESFWSEYDQRYVDEGKLSSIRMLLVQLKHMHEQDYKTIQRENEALMKELKSLSTSEIYKLYNAAIEYGWRVKDFQVFVNKLNKLSFTDDEIDCLKSIMILLYLKHLKESETWETR